MPKTPELSYLHLTPQMEQEQSEYTFCKKHYKLCMLDHSQCCSLAQVSPAVLKLQGKGSAAGSCPASTLGGCMGSGHSQGYSYFYIPTVLELLVPGSLVSLGGVHPWCGVSWWKQTCTQAPLAPFFPQLQCLFLLQLSSCLRVLSAFHCYLGKAKTHPTVWCYCIQHSSMLKLHQTESKGWSTCLFRMNWCKIPF